MNREVLATGVVLYPEALPVPDGIVDRMVEIRQQSGVRRHTEAGPERYDGDRIFNDDPPSLDFVSYSQSHFLKALADYLDVYDEAVWNIFWQESLQFIVYEPGPSLDLGWHSDNKATFQGDHIALTPQRRTVTSLIYLNDDYIGGELELKYFDVCHKPKKGDIIVMPSNFIYSHRSRPVVQGRKTALLISWCTGEVVPGQGEYLT